MPPQTAEPLELFCSYAREDDELRGSLAKHLDTLRGDGLIRDWHDGHITAGREWDKEIRARLESARIILVLVSPDSLSSEYCDFEVARALERHEAGEARVIPVILRPCDWANTPLGKLNALPRAGRAVTLWANADEALLNVVEGVRAVVKELRGTSTQPHAAPAAPKALPPVNLPRPPAVGFVSRRDRQGRDILERLREELSPERGGFVALWGPGGSGKTTLAVEAARALAPLFGGRLALVSALGRDDFSLSNLLDDIATQLGREDLRRAKPADKTELVRALVSASPALVVLDNFETIKPDEQAACAAFVAESRCPALITTRVRVNRDEVTNVRLAAMEPDEAREFLRRLFENEDDPTAFAGLDADALIADCEANPLVMQWVFKQIVQSRRPQDVLEEIERGEGDAAERVFARSFNLLDEDARAALLALTLFAPDASRTALAEVAGFGADARRLDKSVVALAALWLVETTAGNERLLLRGLTRQLAKSRLARDDCAPEFRRRFVNYFLTYAGAHRKTTAEDLDALEREKDNLLGALDATFEAQDWRCVVWLSVVLDGYLALRGYWAEAISTGERALRAARSSQEEASVATLSHNLAVRYQDRGDFAEARRLYEESLGIARRLGDQQSIAITLGQLGRLAQIVGEVEEARRLHEESLEIKRRLGDQISIARTLNYIGALAQGAGEAEQARRLHEESLGIARRLGDQQGIAVSLHQLGRVAQDAGEVEEARRLYGECLGIARRLGDQIGIASTLNNLAVLAEGEGNKREAARLFREALSIYERLGSPDAEVAQENLKRVEGGAS